MSRSLSGALSSRRFATLARFERSLVLALVALAHLAAAVELARFQVQPARPPLTPITVALIQQAAPGPAAPVAAPPVPLIVPQPAAAAEPIAPSPPAPVAPPAHVAVAPPPAPAIVPARPKTTPPARKAAPAPMPSTQTPTAISQPDRSEAAEPSPVTADTMPRAAPAPATPALASPPAMPSPAAAQPGPVTAARFDAAYLNNPKPGYPALSRRMGEQGQVLVRVLVTADGHAGRVELAESSGSARLDKAATASVARWRFVPAHHGGRDIESWVVVPIVFELQGQ